MNLIYPRSAKNQACFEEKNEKKRGLRRFLTEKMSERRDNQMR